jgi:hypothetical protein
MRRVKAAITIQSIWRGVLARRQYRLTLQKIIYIQSCIRRKYARRQLAALKAEARSMGKLQELKNGLETKIVNLSQALQSKSEETRQLIDRLSSLEANIAAWKERCAKSEAHGKNVAADLEKTLDLNNTLQKEVSALTEAKDAAIKERDRAIKAKEDILAAAANGLPLVEVKRVGSVHLAGRSPSPLTRGRSGHPTDDDAVDSRKFTRSPSNLSRASTVNQGSGSAAADDNALEALRNENATLRRMLAQAGITVDTILPVNGGIGMRRSPSRGSTRLPSLESGQNHTSPPTITMLSATPGASSNTLASATGKSQLLTPPIPRRNTARRAFSVYDGDIFTDAERARLERERQRGLAAGISMSTPSLVVAPSESVTPSLATSLQSITPAAPAGPPPLRSRTTVKKTVADDQDSKPKEVPAVSIPIVSIQQQELKANGHVAPSTAHIEKKQHHDANQHIHFKTNNTSIKESSGPTIQMISTDMDFKQLEIEV